ncbi:MAG: biotin--[acetyl-CoA-carboxylase] ligase, partial [Bacteroidales bacterium]|nr:biotin--[acetyl-CoA-carboxylase] ligase [Bacteroidales bacterium]
DVYVGDRKICGMLLEHDLEGMEICRTLVGVGININQHQFRGDAPNPVSLCQLIHKETDREVILQDLLCHFLRHLHEASSEEGAAVLHTAYLRRLYRRRGFHRFRDANGVFKAAIADVKSSGELVLRRLDGSLRAYWFKEVQFERE